jgi:hypothetical protein
MEHVLIINWPTGNSCVITYKDSIQSRACAVVPALWLWGALHGVTVSVYPIITLYFLDAHGHIDESVSFTRLRRHFWTNLFNVIHAVVCVCHVSDSQLELERVLLKTIYHYIILVCGLLVTRITNTLLYRWIKQNNNKMTCFRLKKFKL